MNLYLKVPPVVASPRLAGGQLSLKERYHVQHVTSVSRASAALFFHFCKNAKQKFIAF
jgi:hypothetical protein